MTKNTKIRLFILIGVIIIAVGATISAITAQNMTCPNGSVYAGGRCVSLNGLEQQEDQVRKEWEAYDNTVSSWIQQATTKKLADQLKNKLARLQEQLVCVCHDFTNDIAPGDKGSEVAALQLIMEKREKLAIDFEEKYPSFIFGRTTAVAVSAFQEKYAGEILAPMGQTRGTGFVGATTRAKLNQLYGCSAGN